MVDTNTQKKRTVYKQSDMLAFPEAVMNRTEYGYRWISAERLNEASDGYEPRGWQLFKGPDGKHVRRGDLILAQMPIDMYNAMKEAADEARRSQIRLLIESQVAQTEHDSHEFRKKGGKIKFEFKQE